MRAITEENDRAEIESWYAEAKKQTEETLSTFIHKLITEYHHDYGTICHAVAAAAVGAASAVNHSPTGGITGFQAGCIMWAFMKHWNGVEAPAWLRTGQDMLYPQYKEKFTTISAETWKWLQEKAKEKLTEREIGMTHPDVVAHWESIVSGRVPFGYKVSDR